MSKQGPISGMSMEDLRRLIQASAEQARDLERQLEEVLAVRDNAIRVALDKRARVPDLMADAGLKRARVYQIRGDGG